MSIEQLAYMKQMIERGERIEELGKTTLALAILWDKTDVGNRRLMGSDLLNEFYRVLTRVWCIPDHEARAHCAALAKSFREV